MYLGVRNNVWNSFLHHARVCVCAKLKYFATSQYSEIALSMAVSDGQIEGLCLPCGCEMVIGSLCDIPKCLVDG